MHKWSKSNQSYRCCCCFWCCCCCYCCCPPIVSQQVWSDPVFHFRSKLLFFECHRRRRRLIETNLLVSNANSWKNLNVSASAARLRNFFGLGQPRSVSISHRNHFPQFSFFSGRRRRERHWPRLSWLDASHLAMFAFLLGRLRRHRRRRRRLEERL